MSWVMLLVPVAPAVGRSRCPTHWAAEVPMIDWSAIDPAGADDHVVPCGLVPVASTTVVLFTVAVADGKTWTDGSAMASASPAGAKASMTGVPRAEWKMRSV